MIKTTLSATDKNSLIIWGHSIPNEFLSEFDITYLNNLPTVIPSVDWVCSELDRIWYEQKLDNNKSFVNQPIGVYYSHPVWIMNGIFSASDTASLAHRSAIANYLMAFNPNVIADYGGGFGQLALSMAKAMPGASIHVIEPYPSKVGIHRLRTEPQIQMKSRLSIESYDAIVAQDVLEHVEDPIKLASEIAESARINGKVIFANCFFPVIQSHLPSTFHLRYTFPLVMKALGLRFVGVVQGAEHAQIFERVGKIDLAKARQIESISKLIGPFINAGYYILLASYRIFKKLLLIYK